MRHEWCWVGYVRVKTRLPWFVCREEKKEKQTMGVVSGVYEDGSKAKMGGVCLCCVVFAVRRKQRKQQKSECGGGWVCEEKTTKTSVVPVDGV